MFARPRFFNCNRSQPSATVGERSRWGHYGRAYGESCKSGSFSRFETSRSLVSRGRRGTSWHSNMFHNIIAGRKAGAIILLNRLQKMSCVFRGKRSTLQTSILILRGRHSTSDASRCMSLATQSTPYWKDSIKLLKFDSLLKWRFYWNISITLLEFISIILLVYFNKDLIEIHINFNKALIEIHIYFNKLA